MKTIKVKLKSLFNILLLVSITAVVSAFSGCSLEGKKHVEKPMEVSKEVPPKPVVEKKVHKIVSGDDHSCALIEDQTVKCWGRLLVENNGKTLFINSNTPRVIEGFDGPIRDIVAGSDFNCVILKSGPVQCWGTNSSGQLGDGTLIDSAKPVFVKNIKYGVSKIVAGVLHTCVLFMNDWIACWGNNMAYQSHPRPVFPFDELELEKIMTPTEVNLEKLRVRDIAAGAYHTCVLSTLGAVACWGDNSYGQSGQPYSEMSSNPNVKQYKIVPKLEQGVKQIVAGAKHNCALLVNGKVFCWGSNYDGQTGNSGKRSDFHSDFVRDLEDKVDSFRAGYSTSCSLHQGALSCWGKIEMLNSFWQSNPKPTLMKQFGSKVIDISFGEYHFCTLSEDNKVRCLGANNYGQLGDGTFDNREDASVEVINL